ncbi:hypothetical protein GJ688_02125 [Heliobacillus mobilis]|uniref:DUF2325 domain-containing protein n=1 Tax=Heliobacterium mobile TaxID=28064 RepID=A0A6I3SFE2_HELMO|nr:hypothetical protein [Heliobacterium mobile]
MAEAFGTCSEVYKTIDDIYQRDKFRYYRLARESIWYDNDIVTSSPLEIELYNKKALGILLSEEQKEILYIIKHGWKRIYYRVKDQNILDMKSIDNILGKSYNRDDTKSGAIIIALFLAHILNREINWDDIGLKMFYANALRRLMHSYGHMRINYQAAQSADKERAQKLRETIKARAKITRWNYYHFSRPKDKNALNWNDAYGLLLELAHVSDSVVESNQLSLEEIDSILYTYLNVFGESNENEAEQFLFGGYLVYALLKAYKRVKETYWGNNQETLYLEMENLEKQLKNTEAERQRLEDILKTYEDKIDKLNKKVESEYRRAAGEVQDQLRALEKENEKLRAERELDKQELQSLRELFFNLDKPIEITEEEGLIDLSTINGVIIGGHDRWRVKMKEKLPRWKFFGPEQYNVDLGIANADIVFFFTGYLSHTMYIPAITEARKYRVPVSYLRSVNEENALQEVKHGCRSVTASNVRR